MKPFPLPWIDFIVFTIGTILFLFFATFVFSCADDNSNGNHIQHSDNDTGQKEDITSDIEIIEPCGICIEVRWSLYQCPSHGKCLLTKMLWNECIDDNGDRNCWCDLDNDGRSNLYRCQTKDECPWEPDDNGVLVKPWQGDVWFYPMECKR